LHGQPPDEPIHFGRHALMGDAGFHPRDSLEESRRPPLHHSAFNAERNPKAGAAREFEAGSHDADHRISLAVEPEHPAGDMGVASEIVAPDPMGHDHDRWRPNVLVRIVEIPPEHG